MNKVRLITLLLCSLLSSPVAFSQLTVNPNQTAVVLANKLAGPGITISAPVLTCAGAANGTFRSVTTPIMIDSGIVLVTGKAISTIGLESTNANTGNGTAGDADLTALVPGTTTNDACVLQFDFVPNGDTVSFNYQFGSEEYNNSTCGRYNDVFAFFISGPGIAGTQNMALVPGTTIPVTVNSINNGIPGPPGFPGFCNIINCTSMGPGSPFTSFYIDNTGGTQVTYKGYTTKLRAAHNVIPCNSYHLKIAIADASNALYDSGVFIEAGSLETNNYFFSDADSLGHTINGTAHTIVKGCSPATVNVQSTRPSGVPYTVNFTYGGTAVQGVDFSGPSSAVMPAGSTATTISIAPLATAIGGPKTIEIYLQSPFSCGGYTDTVLIHIIDSATASIISHDTAICMGEAFQILTTGTTGLLYNWTPATGLSNPTVMNPVAAPTGTTTYVMTATLPLSGCAPIVRSINVTVNTTTISIITPDTSVCDGASVQIVSNGTPGLVYNWTPAAGLNDPAVQNPIATPTTTTTYSLTATLTGSCPAYAHVTIAIAIPTINILTPDTAICVGGTVGLRVDGDASFIYHWTPDTYLDNADLKEPVSMPTADIAYELTAMVPGTACRITDHVSVTILPQVIAEASGSKSVCLNDPIPLYATPTGGNYSYQWAGPEGFISAMQNPFVTNATPQHAGIYSVIVTDNITTCSGTDTAVIVVGNAALAIQNMTVSQTIPFGSSIQLFAENALQYTWTPNDGSLNNPNVNNPVATPLKTTTYMLYAHSAEGCLDTASVTISVVNEDDILIPTAFTPNGDGLNDVFRVVNLGNFKLVEMSVFNRWGQVVYHNNGDANNGWTGMFNNALMDMGTYSYLIVIGKPDGSLQPYKGNVTLVR